MKKKVCKECLLMPDGECVFHKGKRVGRGQAFMDGLNKGMKEYKNRFKERHKLIKELRKLKMQLDVYKKEYAMHTRDLKECFKDNRILMQQLAKDKLNCYICGEEPKRCACLKCHDKSLNQLGKQIANMNKYHLKELKQIKTKKVPITLKFRKKDGTILKLKATKIVEVKK